MNQGEAKVMEDILKEKGHSIVENQKDSDALVLVTCTVIETTELKMKKRLSQFSKTGKPVVVAGCMASVQKEEIIKENLNALIVPPEDFRNIDSIISNLASGELEIQRRELIPPSALSKTADAIIPISSGCLGSCTYCITRVARGELRSCPSEFVVDSARKILKEGYKEIRLSAQDTAVYGADINTDLPTLLLKVQEIEGDFRVRVGMMNPDNLMSILQDVIEAYKDPRIYKFLHVPVQSGSVEILKKMGRKYSIDEFFLVVKEFRENFPYITISTDVIVGFPGESDEDFNQTVKLVKKLRPNILNITRFSARPKTKAAKMEDKVPSRIAKDRSRELARIHLEISRDINNKLVGREEGILITEYGKNKTLMGRTNSYKPVVVKDDVKLCEFVDVKITEARDTYLMGKVL
jgi:MiaB-like tRNA modifying enzyme